MFYISNNTGLGYYLIKTTEHTLQLESEELALIKYTFKQHVNPNEYLQKNFTFIGEIE